MADDQRNSRVDPLWKRPQAARYLQVSERTIKRWVREEGFPYEKAGRAVRFRKSAIDRWLKERTEQHKESASADDSKVPAGGDESSGESGEAAA